jgi:hypothetical protein
MSNKEVGSVGELVWHLVWIFITMFLIWWSAVSLMEGSDHLKLDVGILVVNSATLLMRIPMLNRCVHGN